MKLKNQVVNKELSKKIDKLGVKQESLWYWVNSGFSAGFEGGDRIWLCDNEWNLYNFKPDPEYDETGRITKEDGLIPGTFLPSGFDKDKYEQLRDKIIPQKIKDIKVYSAFTVAELGEMLPMKVNLSKIKKDIYYFKSERDKEWAVGYYDGDFEDCILESAKTEANARAKILIYLIGNGLLKEQKK